MATRRDDRGRRAASIPARRARDGRPPSTGVIGALGVGAGTRAHGVDVVPRGSSTSASTSRWCGACVVVVVVGETFSRFPEDYALLTDGPGERRREGGPKNNEGIVLAKGCLSGLTGQWRGPQQFVNPRWRFGRRSGGR